MCAFVSVYAQPHICRQNRPTISRAACVMVLCVSQCVAHGDVHQSNCKCKSPSTLTPSRQHTAAATTCDIAKRRVQGTEGGGRGGAKGSKEGSRNQRGGGGGQGRGREGGVPPKKRETYQERIERLSLAADAIVGGLGARHICSISVN